MKPFTYTRPDDAGAAVAAVGADPGAMFLAGGTNLLDHLKLGVAGPSALVDVARATSTDIVERDDGGLVIGAGALNADVAAHPVVRRDHPVLAQALLDGASGQLRNMATTGGNLLQRTRCAYFADPTTPCTKRDLTQPCSARGGWARYHAILGAGSSTGGASCIATHPSDMAVALVALDATVQVLGPGHEGVGQSTRSVPVAELHRLPGDDPTRDTVLRHGDLITAVELPPSPIARNSAYRKVRDRASYAFAVVSIAVAARLAGDGTLADVRIAFGGLAHVPWRAERAEAALRGTLPTEDALAVAADEELRAAAPLRDNAFKVPLARNLLVRTLLEVTS
jgi:xanthine dehydrogenase YagS FAD-binding subunit